MSRRRCALFGMRDVLWSIASIGRAAMARAVISTPLGDRPTSTNSDAQRRANPSRASGLAAWLQRGLALGPSQTRQACTAQAKGGSSDMRATPNLGWIGVAVYLNARATQ
jgi:hypothetical protein